MGREISNVLQFHTSLSEERNDIPETFSLQGALAAIIGTSCLVYVILMCACKGSGQRKETTESEAHHLPGGTEKILTVAENGASRKSKAGVVIQAAGDNAVPVSDNTSSDQASSASANVRSSTARLLPAPPISSHQTLGKQFSGPELSRSAVKNNNNVADVASQNNQPSFDKNLLLSPTGDKDMLTSDKHEYEHLGIKSVLKPADYDSIGELKSHQTAVLVPETPESSDDDYSELDEKPDPVVIDLNNKRKGLSDPYSRVKDDTELKEEDPYNHIGDSDGSVPIPVIQKLKEASGSHTWESDGSVSSAFIGKLQQIKEQDDPYATVQDDPDRESRNMPKAKEATHGIKSDSVLLVANNFDVTKPLSNGDEYAVIHKTKNRVKHTVGYEEQGSENNELSPYNVSPPEPPRLYTVLDLDTTPETTKHKIKHKYSQVTARESLASISARTFENPYETMADSPENAYSLVEETSVEGTDTMSRHGEDTISRIREINDTYAEIGISGGSIRINDLSNHPENDNSSVNTTMSSSLDPVKTANRQLASSECQQLGQNCATLVGATGDNQAYTGSDDMYVTLKEEINSTSQSASGSRPLETKHVTTVQVSCNRL